MRAVAAFAVIAFASQAALADIKRHQAVPDQLRGAWAPSTDACAADNKERVTLAAKAYTTAEQKCDVDWVSETASTRGAIYSAHMRCTSEANKQPSVINLILRADDAKQISLGLAFNSLKPYQRCPATQ